MIDIKNIPTDVNINFKKLDLVKVKRVGDKPTHENVGGSIREVLRAVNTWMYEEA